MQPVIRSKTRPIFNGPIIIKAENQVAGPGQPHIAPREKLSMSEDRLSAPCPKCHTEMIFVAALPHPKSPTMRKTTFVCYGCNQTRNYALSEEMANAYLASHGDPLLAVTTEPQVQLPA
jgi:hypothetical protein